MNGIAQSPCAERRVTANWDRPKLLERGSSWPGPVPSAACEPDEGPPSGLATTIAAAGGVLASLRISWRLKRRTAPVADIGLDHRLQHRQRRRAGAQDEVVEGAQIVARSKR